MASGLYFIVFLCLTSGLWMEANAQEQPDHVGDDCCERCPPGWAGFGDHCYMFHFDPKDWADAEVACIAIGGNLASVHTQDQYDVFKAMIKRLTGTDTRTWIGGHDSTKEGVWLWSDGSKFEFKHWPSGEPNNSGKTEHCLEMNYLAEPNDIQCTDKKSFICARHI